MPVVSGRAASRLTFGLFEVDIKSGELWKAGYRVKLQMQPFKVLTILLESPGEVVSREEIQKRVWGSEVTVDFESSLGGAVKKVREALGDSADNPRFIETLARRGYRFIAPVGEVEAPTLPSPVRSGPAVVEPVSAANDVTEAEAVPLSPLPAPLVFSAREVASAPIPEAADARPTAPPKAHRPSWLLLVAGFAVGSTMAGAAVQLWNTRHAHQTNLQRISQITHEGKVYSAADGTLESLPGSATDGVRLFTSALEDGQTVIKQISTITGESHTLHLPEEVQSPEISALSPDGSKLLVRSLVDAAAEQPLWVVPVDGGSAFRVSDIKVIDATWMPNGTDILYSTADRLSTIALDNGRPQEFAHVPGRALWLRWSPDGMLLRFTLVDPTSHAFALWQLTLSNRVPRPVPMDWLHGPNDCCGVWTSDGKRFIFQAMQGGHTDLWELAGSSQVPSALTNGPLSYEAPATSRGGNDIFFFGHELRTKLSAYDMERREFVPVAPFLAQAIRVTYSRDHHWVCWTNAQGQLWRAHPDGSDMVRLTPESMRVFLAAWSPDSTSLAVMARNPGKTWLIYTLSASGGNPEPLSGPEHDIGDPSFSADGRYLVFGRVPDSMGQEDQARPLMIRDMSTGQTTAIPGSAGYFSPRWSPDGRFIAALTLDQRRVVLYDFAAHTWKQIADHSAADPAWSSDSKSLFVYAYMADEEPIVKISIPEGNSTKVVGLKRLATGNTVQFYFSGLTAENLPLIRAETSEGNLYLMGKQ